jgi:OmcA/MtrC family decaheme c-type cytochrome
MFMRRYNIFCFALIIFVMIALSGGCSSGNKEGQSAPVATAAPGTVSPDGNLQAEITGVVINSPPVVTFKLFDENGAPLDPASLNIGFYIAQIKADGNYANYFGATAPAFDTTGTIATVGGGVYAYTFSRDIKTTTNLNNLAYNAAKTHTVAIQVSRNITDVYGKAFQQAKNVYFNFRPDGGAVTQTREIVATSNCNACHGKLGMHGGGYQEAGLCILCHNPGLARNGVSLDFKALVHKIHMGENLPGNMAAIALGGSGFSIGGTNYAEVVYPFLSGDSQITARPIECAKCHKAGLDINGRAFGKDAERWRYGIDAAGKIDKTKSAATIENCITCHDTTSFDAAGSVQVADATGYTPKLTTLTAANGAVAHKGGLGFSGAAWTDTQCGGCHPGDLTGDNAYKMSVVGHHTVIENSSLFTGLNFQILSVTGATAGSKPAVTFKITDNSGASLSPAEAGSSYSLKLGYFQQTDYTNAGLASYGQPLSQSLTTATANADGSYSIVFSTAIPAGANGTGVIGLEGRRTYNIPATGKYPARTAIIGGKAIQYFFDLATGVRVTDPTKQRRMSVDDAKCLVCHGRLTLHGGSRVNSIQQCVICHNPDATDKGRRPAVPVDGLAEQSVNFKDMIHKIHTGENLIASKLPLTTGGTDYIIYGYGNSVNNFSKVRYPRDRRDCLACHIVQNPAAFGLPLPDGALGTTTATGADANNAAGDDNSRITPMQASCLSCHDQATAATHASGYVTGSGATAAEGCVACHKTGLLQGVNYSHRPVR